MVFKLRFRKLGGHYHCRLFAAKSPNMTYAKCGDLTFAEDDWSDVQIAMSGVNFQHEDSWEFKP
jgi:hypothetical protein